MGEPDRKNLQLGEWQRPVPLLNSDEGSENETVCSWVGKQIA